MIPKRHFYAVEYPVGFDVLHPVYPFTARVHRFSSQMRRTAHLRTMRRAAEPAPWEPGTARHPVVMRAIRYYEACPTDWPMTVTINHAPSKETN